MADPDIKPGDWVRFYRDAKLVIGVVQYVQDTTAGMHKRIHTDIGEARSDGVLEVRRG